MYKQQAKQAAANQQSDQGKGLGDFPEESLTKEGGRFPQGGEQGLHQLGRRDGPRRREMTRLAVSPAAERDVTSCLQRRDIMPQGT